MAKESYQNVSCPCKDCSTVFSGTNLQIANNFNQHYKGAHINKNDNCIIAEGKKGVLVDVIKEDTYEEIMNNFEPEVTVEDENKISAESTKNPNGVGYNLYHYISDELVCREERQFALYFANKLQSLGKNSPIRVQLENNPTDKPFLAGSDEIIEVFYEAAIMRDYWHVHKKSFNKLLFDYVTSPKTDLLKESCIDEAMKNKDDIFGKDNETHANGWKPPIYIARWMMNAKPDIGLIIKNDENYRLSFIECKYLSGEDEYKYKAPKSNITVKMKQTKLQEHILTFICGELEATYKSNPLKEGQVGLVKFTQDDDENVKSKNNDKVKEGIEIPLKYLLI